jgi:hypothetical protein
MSSSNKFDVVELVKDSEVAKPSDARRTFEYSLSD